MMKSKTRLFDMGFIANGLDGKPVKLNDFKGRVLLIVNTASKCGFTPQYKGLEELYQKYKDQGLIVLGFPCNQFANQEPGDTKAIENVCYVNYGVTFPMFEKIDVNGKKAHPLYVYLKAEVPQLLGTRIKWNFTKFLVDKTGKPIKRFSPSTTPEKLIPDIEALLEL
jgi:glutathione peroxidase